MKTRRHARQQRAQTWITSATQAMWAVTVAAAVTLSVMASGAQAQEADDPADVNDEALVLPGVEITGTAQDDVLVGPKSEAGGDFDIQVGALRDVPRGSAERLLTLAPGLILANHGGQGHPTAVFMRGFDAAEGQDIEFLVDGAPINEVSNPHGHGMADLNFVIPELVESLRVLEGPFDPRQGDFAVAGSVGLSPGLAQRGLAVQGSYGQFNTRRLLTLWGPHGAGPGTFVGVDLSASDGFGPNRASSAAKVMARYEHAVGSDGVLSALLTSYSAEFGTAGVVRLDDLQSGRMPCAADADSQFFCVYDTNQGGAMARHGLVLRYQAEDQRRAHTQLLSVALRRQRIRDNFTGYITDPRSTGPQRGDNLEQAYEALTVAARGSYTHKATWWGQAQALEVGYAARYDDAQAVASRLRADGGQPYKRLLDNDMGVSSLGVYTEAALRPMRSLSVRLGMRVEAFSFSVIDRNQPTQDRDGAREPQSATDASGTAWQPRASVRWDFWEAAGLGWASAFGLGARSSEATALSQGERAPFASVRSAETGLLFAYPTPAMQAARAAASSPAQAQALKTDWAVDARLLGFYTYVSRDMVFEPTAARNVLSAPSHRMGALMTARTQWAQRLDVQGSLTFTEAHQPTEGAAWYAWTDGPRLPYIPRWVLRLDAAWREPFEVGGQPFEGGLAAGFLYLAPKPLPLEQFGQHQARLDVSARLRWRWVEAAVSVQNLLDTRYREVELYYPSNFDTPDAPASQLDTLHFVAGAPLTVLGTLTLTLDGFGADDAPAATPAPGGDAADDPLEIELELEEEDAPSTP